MISGQRTLGSCSDQAGIVAIDSWFALHLLLWHGMRGVLTCAYLWRNAPLTRGFGPLSREPRAHSIARQSDALIWASAMLLRVWKRSLNSA